MKVLYKQKESGGVKHSQISPPNKLLSGAPKIAFWSFLVGVSLLASGCMHTKFTYKDTFSPSPKVQITQEIKEEQIVITKNFLTSELMKPAELLEEMEKYGLEPKINRWTVRISREILLPIYEEMYTGRVEKYGYKFNPDGVRDEIWEDLLIFADNHSVVYRCMLLNWIVCEIPNVDTSKPLKFYNYRPPILGNTLLFENGKGPEVVIYTVDLDFFFSKEKDKIKVGRIELLPEIQPILDEVGGIENLCIDCEKGIYYIFGKNGEGKPSDKHLRVYYHKGKLKKELKEFK